MLSNRIFYLLPLMVIIKLTGAVDWTTVPTTSVKSVVNMQYWFCVLICLFVSSFLVSIYLNACFSYRAISIMKYN